MAKKKEIEMWLSTSKAARLLGVGTITIRELMRKGELKSRKVGDPIRGRRVTTAQWIIEYQQKQPQTGA